MNTLIVLTIAVGLWVDVHWAYGQLAMSLVAWALLFVLVAQRPHEERPALVACLAFATAGEVFLSLVWGIYDYRLFNVPLFVPPGHVLLFYLGTRIAARVPSGYEWWVPIAALPVVAGLAWTGHDTSGPILFAVFLGCMVWSPRGRRLYATMFALSLVMEIWGTWLGNWTWVANVPLTGLTAANPPLAAGAFYCFLDLLVISTCGPRRVAKAKAPEIVALAPVAVENAGD